MFEKPKAGLRILVMVVMVLILGAGTTSASARPAKTTRTAQAVHPATQTEAHAHVTWLTVTGAAGNLWLLGDYPCSSGTCLAIFRSENGGESFVRVGVPPVHALEPRGLPTGSLLFANRQDGYAYSSDGPSGEDSFFWTGDGGTTWQGVQLRGALAAPIVVADGRAYAVTYKCRDPACSSYDFASSPVAENDWTTTRNFLPVETKGQNVSLSAFGSSVWLVLTPQGVAQGADCSSHGTVGGPGQLSRLTRSGVCSPVRSLRHLPRRSGAPATASIPARPCAQQTAGVASSRSRSPPLSLILRCSHSRTKRPCFWIRSR